MNIFVITLAIFVIAYLFLNWFAKTSSKKISKGIRTVTILSAAILAVVMVFAGRFIFSLPLPSVFLIEKSWELRLFYLVFHEFFEHPSNYH